MFTTPRLLVATRAWRGKLSRLLSNTHRVWVALKLQNFRSLSLIRLMLIAWNTCTLRVKTITKPLRCTIRERKWATVSKRKYRISFSLMTLQFFLHASWFPLAHFIHFAFNLLYCDELFHANRQLLLWFREKERQFIVQSSHIEVTFSFAFVRETSRGNQRKDIT
jgi:hypothetical protein